MAIGFGPLLAGALLARPQLRSGLRERFGRIAGDGKPRIWVHASSIGEAKAEKYGEGILRTLKNVAADNTDDTDNTDEASS